MLPLRIPDNARMTEIVDPSWTRIQKSSAPNSGIRAVLFFIAILFSGTNCWGQTVGAYPLQTIATGQYDEMNLGDLSIGLELPIRSKQGPIPFSFVSHQQVYVSPNCYITTCVATLGGNTFNSTATNTFLLVPPLTGLAGSWVNYSTSAWTCPDGSKGTRYYGWIVYSADGGAHVTPSLPDPQALVLYSCGGINSGSVVTMDGSGYTVVAQATGPSSVSIALHDKSGASLSNNGIVTDRNGNTLNPIPSETVSPPNCNNQNQTCVVTDVYTDSLNTTPLTVTATEQPFVLFGCGQASVCVNMNIHEVPSSFAYADASGNTVSYSISYSTYHFATAFGCGALMSDATGTQTVNLPTAVTFPDGSRLLLTYEQTPGYGTGYSTGRLTSLTLPTGGLITYAYSGGTNGINCNDGSPAVVTRTTLDGTWTYNHTESGGGSGAQPYSSTTVTDPQGNSSSYNFLHFGGGWLRLQKQERDSSSTLLRTTVYCYNGQTNLSNCAAGTSFPYVHYSYINYPTVTEQTAYIELPNSSGLTSETDVKYTSLGNVYSNYGLITEEDTYDWGHGAPGGLLAKNTKTYGTWNGSACVSVGSYINDLACDTQNTDGTHVATEARYTRDARGNATTIAKWTGSGWLSSSATYNTNGTINVATDVNGAQATYSYAGCNSFFTTQKAQIVTSQDTLTTQYVWDCNGAVETSTTDSNGNSTAFGFTASGADPFWRTKSTTDPLQNTTAFSYSPFVSGVTNPYVSTSMSFNSGASVSAHVDYLDGLGRVVQSQVQQSPTLPPTYDTASYTFNGDGRPYSTSMPCSVGANTNCSTPVTTQTYDAVGRPKVTTSGDGVGTVTKAYSNNDVLETVGPAPAGEHAKQRQYEYDGLGRLTSVCEVLSSGGSACGQNTAASGYSTSYAYSVPSVGGSKLVITQGVQTRTYIRDALGRLTSETNPETGTTTYVYDSVAANYCGTSAAYSSQGDVVAKADANGTHVCYYYDSLHRVTDVTTSNPGSTNPCRRFRFDNSTGVLGTIPTGISLSNVMGHVVEAETDTCASPITQASIITDEWFSYSARGEMTDLYESTPHSGGFYHTTVGYWANGVLKSLAGVGRQSQYTYGVDGEGRLYSASQGTTNFVSKTTYNTASQPLVVSLYNSDGDNDSYTYDPNTGRMTNYTFTVGSTPKSVSGTLQWNSNGTLSKLTITDGFNSGGTQTCKYGDPTAGPPVPGYDDLGRLLKVDCGSVWGQTFTYDQFGNVTKSGSITWNPGYNTNNQYTLAGTSYDLDGNLIKDTFHQYTWDAYGHPATITTPNSTVTCGTSGTCLTYDALGRVVEENNSGAYSEIEYSPVGKVAVMNGTTQKQAYVPLPGGEVLSPGPDTFWHRDWLGSIRLASSANSRTVTFDRAFAPFGEMYDTVTGGTTNGDFTGHTRDTISDEYDTANRELHPTQGRWVSPDPGGLESVDIKNPQTWNRYAYVNNNPLALADPEGLCFGSGASSDGSQGGAGGNGAEMDLSIFAGDYGLAILEIQATGNLPFGQGISYTIDGFSATPEEGQAMLASGAGVVGLYRPVTVPENVIFDQDANDGKGLTSQQIGKFKNMQKQTEDFYAQVGIQFKVTYTEGHVVFTAGGNILNVFGVAVGQLNVFVFGDRLPLILRGAWGEGGLSTIGSQGGHKYAVTFIGLRDADAFTLKHEFAHHFIGNTLGKSGFFKNLFIDIYINDFVLPNVKNYGDTMRGYAQQILNP